MTLTQRKPTQGQPADLIVAAAGACHEDLKTCAYANKFCHQVTGLPRASTIEKHGFGHLQPMVCAAAGPRCMPGLRAAIRAHPVDAQGGQPRSMSSSAITPRATSVLDQLPTSHR